MTTTTLPRPLGRPGVSQATQDRARAAVTSDEPSSLSRVTGHPGHEPIPGRNR